VVRFVEEASNAKAVGGSLSCAEILVFLKFAWMRNDDTFAKDTPVAIIANTIKGHGISYMHDTAAVRGYRNAV
jgi:transketolase N-terminal domain/subunit